jgi:hypothetical protein
MVTQYQGRYQDALDIFTKIPPDKLDDETVSPLLHLGRLEEARRAAQACLRKSSDDPICTSAYALIGKKAAAVEWLAAAHGLPCYPILRDDPFLAGLKGDPAFDALLSRLKTRWEGYRRELRPPPA